MALLFIAQGISDDLWKEKDQAGTLRARPELGELTLLIVRSSAGSWWPAGAS